MAMISNQRRQLERLAQLWFLRDDGAGLPMRRRLQDQFGRQSTAFVKQARFKIAAPPGENEDDQVTGR
ncbi:hypothetical protein HNR60_003788 [Rhodopseudomonas rhenobacensis]|uniref:Uncharacterized protein n=1 Tax=Rhodopseudomonas rhenobacensis TaxID=87461 RepID=A0A7W7Z6M5_9BRAD|nr:hypothetical protein [Rhodopseudomonas rhenobacensis]MBB5049016.1 hypothetical protein [Rhodopseudomonas rhenobacensis]